VPTFSGPCPRRHHHSIRQSYHTFSPIRTETSPSKHAALLHDSVDPALSSHVKKATDRSIPPAAGAAPCRAVSVSAAAALVCWGQIPSKGRRRKYINAPGRAGFDRYAVEGQPAAVYDSCTVDSSHPSVVLFPLARLSCSCSAPVCWFCSRYGARGLVRPSPPRVRRLWLRRRISCGCAVHDAAAATASTGRGDRRGNQEEPERDGAVAAGGVLPRGEAAHRRARYRRRACRGRLSAGQVFLGTSSVWLCRALAEAVVVAHDRVTSGAGAAANAAAAGDGRAVVDAGGSQDTGCEVGYSEGDGVASGVGEAAPGRRRRGVGRGGGERVRLRCHQLRVGRDHTGAQFRRRHAVAFTSQANRD
jgi:hypothetical protein